MSTATTERPAALFRVDVRLGCYSGTPHEKCLKVTVTVPDLAPVELLIPADMPQYFITDGGRTWVELAREAIRRRNACSASERADVAALCGWLADGRNADALNQAWATHRLRQLQHRLRKAHTALAEHCQRWELDASAQADAVGQRVTELRNGLALWETRDDTKAQPAIRRAGAAAVNAIDAQLAELYRLRARLVSEIRQSDDAAAARVDRMLSEAPHGGNEAETQ
jgi:hypothetical protein